MKNIFLLFIALFLLIAGNLAGQESKPLVVASASIFADMAENIAGEFVEIKSIVPIGGDPHIYEPTPSDAILASKADLILRNGLTFEGWLNELIENSGTEAELCLITEGITPITSKLYKSAPDPHAWMDAEYGIVYAENIKNALVRILPDYTKEIEFNFNAYKSTLESLHELIIKKIESIPEERRVLITSHDAFQYYGRKYGLRLESVLGTSTEAQAQTSDIVRLNKVIKNSGVPAVFIETTVNPKLLAQIAADNGVKVGGKLFSDSLGDKDSDAPTYVDMLKFNTEAIVGALTGESIEDVVPQPATSSNLIYWLIPLLALGLLIAYFVFRGRNN